MYIVVGLGNPGKKYEDTRHNVGFKAISYLSEKWSIPVRKVKFRALIGEGIIGGEKILLAKPATFMNLSGESVLPMAEYYGVNPANIIVIHDDVALPTGRLRIRAAGSDGGHNGIKSIIYSLQSDTFVRIKIGVGAAEYDMVHHVLGTFSKEDGVAVTTCIKQTDAIIETVITENVAAAMNKFNAFGRE